MKARGGREGKLSWRERVGGRKGMRKQGVKIEKGREMEIGGKGGEG